MQFEFFARDETTSVTARSSAMTAERPHEQVRATSQAVKTCASAGPPKGTYRCGSPGFPAETLEREKLPAEVECKMIVSALRATNHEEFVSRIEPFLTDQDRERIALCSKLPYQLVNHAWNPIVERLNRRWGALQGGWLPFARVIEPAKEVAGLRVITLELNTPSRGLEGRVAFAVSRRLDEVAQPIPLSVIELAHEARKEGWFQAIAFLEPIFGPGKKHPEIMRSQAQVQRTHARLIDPLVVGFLGAGPVYWMREQTTGGLGRRRSSSWSISQVRATQFMWCLGHWD